MRQRRFMAMILIVMVMTWTLGTSVMASGSNKALTLKSGLKIALTGGTNSTSGGGVDITPPPNGGTTTTTSTIGVAPGSVAMLGITGITVNKNKVIQGDTVTVTLRTNAESTMLASTANVCYVTGIGQNETERVLAMTLQPDGSFLGAFAVDDTVVPGIWKVKYATIADTNGIETTVDNSALNGGMGQNFNTADIVVLDDTISGLDSVTVSSNVASQIDRIQLSVDASVSTLASLAPEANACYSVVNKNGRFEKQITLKLDVDGSYKGFFNVDDLTERGIWKLEYVIVNSSSGNVRVFYNIDTNPEMAPGINMSTANIEVPEVPAPEFESIQIDKKQAFFGEQVGIEVTTTSETGTDLAPEASICFTTGTGVNEVENQLTLRLGPGFTYKGTMSIDEFSQAGIWKVKYVIINDKKDNARITYNSGVFGFGVNMDTGNLEVLGDKVPEFESLSVTSNTAKSGDTVGVRLTTDAMSPAVLATEAYVCYSNGSGDTEVENQMVLHKQSDGSYLGNFFVDQFTTPGKWSVKYVAINDIKGNVKIVYNSVLNGIGKDLSAADIEVAAVSVPGLVSIGLDKNTATNGDTINFVLTTTENSAAGSASEAYVCYTIGSGTQEVERQLVFKLNSDGTYIGSMNIDEFTMPGVWKIKYVILGDDKDNIRITYNSVVNNGVGKDLSAGDFNANTSVNFTVDKITLDNIQPKLFETVNIAVEASVSMGELADSATVCYTMDTKNGPIDNNVALTLKDGKYVGAIEMDNSNYESGVWRISYIILENKSGDVAVAYNRSVHGVVGINLMAGNFTYTSPIEGFKVNGNKVYNYRDVQKSYDFSLLPWDTNLPKVTVMTASNIDNLATSTIEVKDSAELPGTAQVVVTSKDDPSKFVVYNLNLRNINTGYSVEYLDNNNEMTAGTTESVSVKVTNNVETEGNPVLVIALFDKHGDLVKTVKTTAKVAKGQSTTLTAEIAIPEGIYTVRTFVWQSEANARPLAKYKEYSVVQP